jgi:osmoprotectant transport system permease protein
MNLNYLLDNEDIVWELTIEHLQLVVTALLIAMPIALVAAIVAVRFRPLSLPIVTLAGFLYTIPSLALLAFLIPTQGIGRRPALIMLVIYAQMFLVRNIVTGMRGVDASVLEAARGVGMNPVQVFVRVWLPLALPVIIAGIRSALVALIGLAAIAGWISAGGLGELMFTGIGSDNPSKVLAGVIAVTALAIVCDVVLRLFEMLTPAARALRVARA